MVGERIKDRLDRPSVIRRVESRFSNPGHSIRSRMSGRIGNRVPEFQHRNFGGGIGAGIVGAAVATILDDTVGIPFGGSADVVDVQPAEDGTGTLYRVNVNAPTENMAKARGFIDAGTGFSSVLTDVLDVQDVEVIGTRTLRDTYQVTLKIRD